MNNRLDKISDYYLKYEKYLYLMFIAVGVYWLFNLLSLQWQFAFLTFDEPNYCDYYLKLRTEGRWVNYLLFKVLGNDIHYINVQPFLIINIISFALFSYRVFSNVQQNLPAIALTIVALLYPSFIHMQYSGITLCSSYLLLLCTTFLYSRIPLVPFFLIFGILFNGVISHYYFLLPLLFLKDKQKIDYRFFVYWVLGFLIGYAVAQLVTFILSGDWIRLAEWRGASIPKDIYQLLLHFLKSIDSFYLYFDSYLQVIFVVIIGIGLLGILCKEGKNIKHNMLSHLLPYAYFLVLFLEMMAYDEIFKLVIYISLSTLLLVRYRKEKNLYYLLMAMGFIALSVLALFFYCYNIKGYMTRTSSFALIAITLITIHFSKKERNIHYLLLLVMLSVFALYASMGSFLPHRSLFCLFFAFFMWIAIYGNRLQLMVAVVLGGSYFYSLAHGDFSDFAYSTQSIMKDLISVKEKVPNYKKVMILETYSSSQTYILRKARVKNRQEQLFRFDNGPYYAQGFEEVIWPYRLTEQIVSGYYPPQLPFAVDDAMIANLEFKTAGGYEYAIKDDWLLLRFKK